jgi:hypothetical protein
MRNAPALRPVVSVEGTPFALLVVLGLGFGAAVGIVAAVSPPLAGALTVVAAAVAFSRGRLPDLAGLGVILIVGVPVAAAGESVDTFLSVPLGPIHPPFQILLALGITVLSVVLASNETLSYLLSVLRRGASGMVLVWVLACIAFFMLGASRNGFAPAGRQFMYLSVYLWVVPVIIVSRRRAAHALSGFLALILIGTTLSALISLATFAFAPLRAYFFSVTQWAESVRVPWSATSVYVLVLPVALLLASSKSAGRLRLLGRISSPLMVGAVLLTQFRAVIAACVLNVILVILLPGAWRLGVRRWRVLGGLGLIALMLVVALVTAGSLGVRSATVLPQELSQRLGSLASGSSDHNYQTRQLTNDIALSRWQADPISIISGQGLGASIGFYAAGSSTSYDRTLWADNAWVTLAVQGGLIALAIFALVLIGAFVSFLRAARSPADPQERLIARALMYSLPGLLFSSLFFSHLLQAPGLVVALCTLLAAADVVWCAQRDPNNGRSPRP